MKKIILFRSPIKNGTVSYAVTYMYEMLLNNKHIFKENNFELIDILTYTTNIHMKNKLLNDDHNLQMDNAEILDIYINDTCINCFNCIKNNEEYNNCIILAFGGCAFSRYVSTDRIQIINDRNITTIMWQDDIQDLIKHSNNGNINDDVKIHVMEISNIILTPSIEYMKNINCRYLNKSIFYFYAFDEKLIQKYKPTNFNDRKCKIVLSGSMQRGYKTRVQLYDVYRASKTPFSNLIDFIHHPGYDRRKNAQYRGENYYDIISQYKAAFLGFYEYPLNFLLAKVVEILGCGTIGIIEPNPLLKEELGLIEYVHYVPMLMDENGIIIQDVEYYKKYLNTDEGNKIALNGYNYIKNNLLTKNRIQQLIKILNDI